jgi:hypothetical protein
MNRCIFRYSDKNGVCCTNNTINLLCPLHSKNKKNKVFYLTNKLFKDPDREINEYEILEIYCLLYKEIFDFENRKTMLYYLLGKKNRIIYICNKFGINNKKDLKQNLFNKLIDKLEWFCIVKDFKNTKRKFHIFFKYWKLYLNHIIGIQYLPSSNSEDIFSFDSLSSIENIFYLKDNNITYGFDIRNLYHFIKNSGSWNPYTKNEINEYDLKRLKSYIRIKNIIIDNNIFWNTPLQAYTDVVLKMEGNGFFIDINWFILLSFNDIIRVINKYHQLSILMPINYLCNERIHNVYPDYIFKFCRMLMELLNNTDDPEYFTYNCLLYKALTSVSKKFRDAAPSWINDIQPNYYIEINMYSI